MAAKYTQLQLIYRKLVNQNKEIQNGKQQLWNLEIELSQTRGIFKGKQRKQLQEKIEYTKVRISNMESELSNIVKREGYENIKEFLQEFHIAEAENEVYQKEYSEWKKKAGEQIEPRSIK